VLNSNLNEVDVMVNVTLVSRDGSSRYLASSSKVSFVSFYNISEFRVILSVDLLLQNLS